MVTLYREIREKEDTHSSSIFLQIVKSYLCVKVMGDEMNVSSIIRRTAKGLHSIFEPGPL